jgi:hypothetical protein
MTTSSHAYKLDELLARITSENAHREADFGAAQGKEASWQDPGHAGPSTLFDEVSKGLDDVTAGRVRDAREALTTLKKRRSEERPN